MRGTTISWFSGKLGKIYLTIKVICEERSIEMLIDKKNKWINKMNKIVRDLFNN